MVERVDHQRLGTTGTHAVLESVKGPGTQLQLLTIHGAHHNSADVDRLCSLQGYCLGGLGPQQIEIVSDSGRPRYLMKECQK